MGYYVYITRKNDWSDEAGPIISQDEWRNYVASDPEMIITGVAEHTNPQGETVRISQPLLTEWRGHDGKTLVWFSYFEGNIGVKNPDEETFAKMRSVAFKLHARVQGDDGEYYDLTDAPTHKPYGSLLNRVLGWFKRSRPVPAKAIEQITLPFCIGDRVRDVWGNEHTVTEIDPTAEHGLGIIRTRRDDGTELSHMIFAHELTSVIKRQE